MESQPRGTLLLMLSLCLGGFAFGQGSPNPHACPLPEPSCTLLGSQSAGLIRFTRHDRWRAAAGAGVIVVDFDELPDGQKTNGTGALSPWGILDTSGSSVNVDPPGPVDQFVTASTSQDFDMFHPGSLPSEPNFLSNDPTFPGGAAATGDLEIDFSELRAAVGFYIADQYPLDGFRILLYEGANSVGTVHVPALALPDSFVGIVSAQLFDRMKIEALHAQDSWGLDRLEHSGTTPGSSYCPATHNSTGFAANLFAAGSASLAQNELVLLATPVPDDLGVFAHGPIQTAVPFGNGTLCVRGGLTRKLPLIQAQDGIASTGLDLQGLGIPLGRWNFQYWMRDPAAGGALYNTSTAYSIDFVP